MSIPLSDSGSGSHGCIVPLEQHACTMSRQATTVMEWVVGLQRHVASDQDKPGIREQHQARDQDRGV